MSSTTNVDPGMKPGWLSQAPSGDLSLDDIFASLDAPDPSDPSATQTPDPAVAPGTPATQPESMFLDAGQTKYKTAEEAAKGVRQKDDIIKKLREDAISRTGIDPLTGKQVAAPQVGTQPAETRPVSYLEDDDAFFKELVDANTARDPRRYKQATIKLVQEMLAPYVPVIADVNRQGAEHSVNQKFSDFSVFKGTDAFRETLDRFPTLRGAIEQAEHNPAMREILGELYEMTYLTNQGTKLPEALRTTPTTPNVVALGSPTLQPVTPTPSSQNYTQPGLTTSEGRKAIIQNFESRGLQNVRF